MHKYIVEIIHIEKNKHCALRLRLPEMVSTVLPMRTSVRQSGRRLW